MERTNSRTLIVMVLLGVIVLSGITFIKNIYFSTSTGKKHVSFKTIKRVASKDFSGFKGLNMATDDIKLKFEGKDLNLTLPIYVDTNRYYVPLTEIIDKLGGASERIEGKINIDINNKFTEVDINNKTVNQPDKTFKLRKQVIISEDVAYISLFDFTKIFDLKTDWDIEHDGISFYWNREKTVQKEVPPSGKLALIRLEDVTASYIYARPEALEKLRIITDYLYTENIPFHVAWIPRYVNPNANPQVDVDLCKQYSMLNADFLFTLDYMMDRNGIIGLHGYTHQYANTQSIIGTEFHLNPADGIPASDQHVRERISLAIDAAKKLDIPYGFFEAPHYVISPDHLKILEDNFDYIYEHYPGFWGKIVEKKNGNRKVKYIPTPLEFVVGKGDVDRMIGKIYSLKSNRLGSFFYHPYFEFEDITITKDAAGYPAYTYSESSVLHQLTKAFKDKGYKFLPITDL